MDLCHSCDASHLLLLRCPTSGARLRPDGDILLERLESQHEKGLILESVWSEEDSRGLLLDEDVELLSLTAETLFDMVKECPTICEELARNFHVLHGRWRVDQERHSVCKKTLIRDNKDLFMRLMAFIADLVDYRHSCDVQERMDYVLPTATGLFNSPIYFPQQPQQGTILNSFIGINGLTVLQSVEALFGTKAPHLEGVCTAHTLAPLLKRLFGIGNDCFDSKEFKEFRKEFNRSTGIRLSIMGQQHGCGKQQQQQDKKKLSKKKNYKR